MIVDCVKNSQTRPKSNSWFKEYSDGFSSQKREIVSIPIIQNSCAKKSIMDSRWKRPQIDDETLLNREIEAQKEIDVKRGRVGLTTTKGAYQYISDPKDMRQNAKRTTE